MQKFDLYWAPINFKEDIIASVKRSKIRPVMVLDPDIPLCLVVEITSHAKRDAYDYVIKDWQAAGLSKPSVIRFSYKLQFSQKYLLDYIGRLSLFDINALKELHLCESLNEGAANSNGIYSLKKGWLKQPERDDIPDTVELEPELSEWQEKATQCNTVEEIDTFINDLYKLRQESLLTEGEYGKGNLIFKELRNNNTLQNLREKKIELENDEMSLKEELTEEQRVKQQMMERRQRCVEYYHRLMETTSQYAATYDRAHPIIDEGMLERTTAKFGYGSEDIAKFIKGE